MVVWCGPTPYNICRRSPTDSRIDAWRNATWRAHDNLPSASREPAHGAAGVASEGKAVQLALRDSAGSCIPKGAVVLSIADPSVARLRELSLRRVARLQCFMPAVITLCLDGYTDSRGGTCVPAATQTRKGMSKAAGGSRHRSEKWSQLSWAKWPLLHVALSEGGARMALFIDADVLLLRNPFARMDAAQLAWPNFHHQEDCLTATDRPAKSCEQPCRLNTGFLLVTSASFCWEVLRSSCIRAGGQRACRSTKTSSKSVGMKAFPKTRPQRDQLQLSGSTVFASHCSEPYAQRLHVRGIKRINRCQLVAYHATCLYNVSQKLAQLEATLSQVERRCKKRDLAT